MTKKIKKDNKILLEYRTKYYFISCVLDILEEKKNLQQQDKVGAQERYNIFLGRYSNMRWMGLIGLDKTTSNWGITLTDAGKNAFQSQIYHSIAANLYYSKKTEKLSKASIAIAVVSMLIALAALIWGILT